MMIQIGSLENAGRAVEALGFRMDNAPMDFLIVTDRTSSAWATRRDYEWQGGKLRVVSPEGLILLKKLRRLCLSLARSSAGREVIRKHPANDKVRRTPLALGR